MAFRRRGARGGRGPGRGVARGRSAQNRLLEKLRSHKPLALRDVSAIERPQGIPDDVEIGTARRRERRVALVASLREGPDLLGWGRLAAQLAGSSVDEILIACPLFGAGTRRLAAVASDGPPLRLVSVPALADSPDALIDEDGAQSSLGWRPTSGALLDRVLRVVEAAAITSGAGAVRQLGDACVLYLHGVRALTIRPENDGVGVECLEPERRQLRVSESNLSSRAAELSELVLRLAQDPRLLERDEARRDAASESVADAVGVRITSHWMPWTVDGKDPIDWVGIDGSGRAVVGVQRSALGMGDASAILTACQRVRAEREQWAPGSAGRVRVVIACDDIDARVLELLEAMDVDLEARPLGGADAGESGERRGRRRGRRRRRPRDEEARAEGAEEPRDEQEADGVAAGSESESASESAFDEAPRGRSRRGRRRRPAAEAEAGEREEASERELGEPSPFSPDEADGAALEAPARDADSMEGDEAPLAAASSGTPDVAETDALPLEARAELDADAEEPEAEEAVDPLALEIEATLAEEPEEEEGEEPEPIERDKPRVRRQRAAIAVHNDADSIMAALVLARERRHIVFFYVCGQDELMDFFRGKATDVDENSDMLLVGFNAAPLPRETISMAEVYRGRLHWFDHHAWAIEDLEALRDAIGRDSIAITEDAASPLVPIMEVAERRSRFTDKVVDLAARRLSESDMEKWGYRVVALVDRMRERSGDYRNDISPILSGKPAELPEGEGTYAAEAAWLEENDPRLIHFGEYQMAVLQVPDSLDAGEVARRARIKTGARLSLSARGGDATVLLACNDEKRHINVMGLVDTLASRHAWTQATPGGDRVGRLRVEDLGEHPERIEALIGDIVRHKSILYG